MNWTFCLLVFTFDIEEQGHQECKDIEENDSEPRHHTHEVAYEN